MFQIHEQGTMPNPRSSGFNIDTGQTTSVSLRTKRVTKLPRPYGNCTGRKHLKGVDSVRYSYSRCVDICQARYIYDHCDCACTALPATKRMRKRKAKFCYFFDNSTVSTRAAAKNILCERKAKKSFGSHGKFMNCNCLEPCEYLERGLTVTHTRWPSPFAIYGTYYDYSHGWENITSYKHYQQLGEVLQDWDSDQETKERLFWSNFARVNVFFHDMQVVSITSIASITMDTLFSNIGGSISLWIGLSFITVIEFFMFGFSLCKVCWKTNLRS